MEQSNTQKAIRGMSSQTFVTFLIGIIEIASFSIMSRLLSQSDFGYYAALTAITAIFASFAETGIGSAIIQKKSITSEYINNAFTISSTFGLFLTFSLIVLAKPLAITFADQSMIIPLKLMSITLLCSCMTSVNISIMYRKLEFLKVGMSNLTSLLLTTIVSILLAYKGYGYYAIICKAVLGSVLNFLLSLVLAKTHYKIKFSYKIFKEIFGFSGWLMASVLFRNVAQQLDKLLMTKLLSVNALGAYNRPKEFINQITTKLGNIFDTALFPVLSQLQDKSVEMKNAYLRSMYLLNLAAFVLTIGFVFNAELFIRIFFGEKWLSVVPVFQILALAIITDFDGRLADCYLRSMGLTKKQFFFRIAEVSAKVIGLLMGHQWGIIGIATSVVIVELIMMVIKHLYISHKLNVRLTVLISSILNSKIYVVVTLLLFFFAHLIIPTSITGNILNVVLLMIYIIITFIICPDFIGEDYKKEIYLKVYNKIKRK